MQCSVGVSYTTWIRQYTAVNINTKHCFYTSFVSLTITAYIQNKANIRSASASIELSPKQTYSFDSSIQTTEYKKKILYKLQLSIRSPTSELVAFGGSFTNVYGKNIELDVILDKIVAKPITMKSKL